MYSGFNLRRKLKSKDFSNKAIDLCIIKLEEKGYIDDYKYATSWVESRLKNKLDSRQTLLAGLMNKGINSKIANEIVNEYYSNEIEENIIKKSVEKHCRQGKTSDKIIKALIRKGFNIVSVNYYVKCIGSIDEGD